MPPKNNSNPSFRDLRDTLDMAKDQLATKEELVGTYLSSTLGVDIKDIEKLHEDYTAIDIQAIEDDETINQLYERIRKGPETDDGLNNLETDREESRISLKKQLITTALKELEDMNTDREKLADLEEEYNNAVSGYADYISSEQYDRDIEARIEEMRNTVVTIQETIATTSLADEKYVFKKKLAAYNRDILISTQRYTLEYLYERVDDPDSGEAEKSRIVESFFNKRRSAYVMKRYRAKCGQFGMPAESMYMMMNLEEKFLEPEFHVYNNFYLFFVISKIAYVDANAIKEVKQPMQNINNLIYNRFPTEAGKEAFLDSVRGFLQRFAEYRVEFSEKNITHPQHPVRIEKDEDRRLQKKGRLIEAIKREDPNLDKSKNLIKLEIDELEYLLSEIRKAKIEQKAPKTCVEAISEQLSQQATLSSIAQGKLNMAALHADDDSEVVVVGRGNTTPIVHRAATPEEVKALESESE